MSTPRLFSALCLLLAAALPAAAQVTVQMYGGTPQGRIPLADAWVFAPGTGDGARTNASGTAVLPNTASGLVTVQKPGWTAAMLEANGAALETELTAGDVNGDGFVDLRDVALLVEYAGERPDSALAGVPRWHPAFDYDGSARLDTHDLRTVAVMRGAQGEAPAYRLIDDAESPTPETELPLGSYWQTLSDATYNGGTSTTVPASLSRVPAVSGGAHGSALAVRYQYTLGAGFEFRFALLRVLLTASDAIGIDATAYGGLDFWLKGNGVPLIVSLKSGPTSGDFGEYEYRIDAAPAVWTRYRLQFDADFRQPEWAQPQELAAVLADLQAIQFKSASGVVGEQGDLWVDDLQFRYAGAPADEGTLEGHVVDGGGLGVPFARVRAETGFGVRTVVTDADGRFTLRAAVGEATIAAERAGYDDGAATVQVALNETTPVEIVLAAQVPTEKPASTGPVRLTGGALETDFDGDGTYDPYFIKGAAFSIAPIGSSGGVSDDRLHDRAAAWLDTLNANTFRTYSGVSPYMMDRAAERGLRAIAGFWVSYTADLGDAETRAAIVDEFRAFVRRYKDHPALLMWTLGNEQNYQNGDDAHWYSLAEELAVAAYEEEGASYHPVSINNGGLFNIGDAAKFAHDDALRYTDLWAVNVYQPDLTAQFFNPYRSRTAKPVVVTEFGIDALDDRTQQPYEDVQASFDGTNWNQIAGAADICVGATVFEFTDEWWKAGNPSTHDPGGYVTGSHPDGYSNEEWWGLVAVTPDTDGDGLDEWRARPAYFTLQTLWAPSTPE